MIPIRKVPALIAASCLFVPLAASAEIIDTQRLQEDKKAFIADHGDLKIRSIRISGLKRTKETVVSRMLSVRPGDPLSTFNPVAFSESVLQMRIFSGISVSYAAVESGVDILVYCEEKWTLIPLPLVYAIDDTRAAGMFLMDTNVFGYQKSVYLGGIYSNKGWSSTVGYMDPRILFSNYTGSIFISKNYSKIENADRDGDIYQSYIADKFQSHLVFGYIFNILTASLIIGYSRIDVSKIESRNDVSMPHSERLFQEGIRFQVKNTKYRFYFDRGLQARLDCIYGRYAEEKGDSSKEVKLISRYTVEAYRGCTVIFDVVGAYADLIDVYEYRLGGRTGSKSLPYMQIPADKYASGTVSFQVPVYNAGWGIFTAVGFFEYGAYARNEERREIFTGPGLGIRMYLRNIAMPALGFDVCYGILTREYYSSFVAGFQFGG